MKMAIVGYGKMGRMIERLATERGINVAVRTDDSEGITAENFKGVDVAIEFSVPSAVVGNIERIAALGVNIVVGTTGWQERMEHVKQVVAQTRNRPGLEPQLFDRSKRVLPHRKCRRQTHVERA